MARVFENDKCKINMINLLLVGDGRSIFFVEYVKALKKVMDVEVFVYCPFPKNDWYNEYPYDHVYFDNGINSSISRLPVIGYQARPWIFHHNFLSYLKKSNTKFDIIHFHWLLPSWIINPSLYRKYTRRIGVSFWGGEMETGKILNSHKLYLKMLNSLMTEADFGIGSTASTNPVVYELYPQLKGKCNFGIYGSSVVGLFDDDIKLDDARFEIPNNKVRIQLGYSGKEIHQHIKILDCILRHPQFECNKSKIHFIAPMTRGATEDYLNAVEDKLSESGCSYTLIKNCYLTDEEVAYLRKNTDITLQFTKFDEISTSIVEALSAGSLMIAGDWYPNYTVLEEYGFKWISAKSIKDGVDVMFESIENIPEYNDMLNHNKAVGQAKFSWNECIKNWSSAYRKFLG